MNKVYTVVDICVFGIFKHVPCMDNYIHVCEVPRVEIHYARLKKYCV